MSHPAVEPLPSRFVPSPSVVRVAAIGDLHVRGTEDTRRFAELRDLRAEADLLVVAGDLTDSGRVVEAEAAGELLALAKVPVVTVLGNHDLRSLRRRAFRHALETKGVEVLECSATWIELERGPRIGIAGTTGCGGGFWPVEGPNAIQNRSLKRLALRARNEFVGLDRALQSLDADVRIAVTHFAPTTSTLGHEPLVKYWMLGNCELGVVLDEHRPDLVIHGHAHLGNCRGRTPGGVPVRNVAWPVTRGVHTEILQIDACASLAVS
jgi:Icc-related predicted phosphoesterase